MGDAMRALISVKLSKVIRFMLIPDFVELAFIHRKVFTVASDFTGRGYSQAQGYYCFSSLKKDVNVQHCHTSKSSA